MAKEPTQKDLTSILELSRIEATGTPPEGSEPETLPTGDEPSPGESPLDFQTSVDADHFGAVDVEATGAESPIPDDFLSSLPPIDPDVEAIAHGTPDEDPALAPLPAPTSTPPSEKTTMEAIRDYSDGLTAEHARPATTGTPHSLLIEGALKTHEKERLVQILNQEKIGIREVELEPQFAGGRILIPRISEYAGVLLVQALRNSRAQLRLGPSDRIFARASDDEVPAPAHEGPRHFFDDRDPTFLEMPVTTDQTFADAASVQVIDTLHGSLLIQAAQVVSSRSAAIEEGIEKLKRQMKLQARFRGANGIVAFRTELYQNPERSHYTVIAQGVAVKTT